MTVVARRFHLAYLALAVALGAAVGLAIVIFGGGASTGRGSWSPWKPHGRGLSAMQEIAGHVGVQYRLPSGKQLVGVVAQSPQLQQQVPLSVVAISSGLPDERPDEVKYFRASDAILYLMCGFGGEACAIPEGKPSTERAMLLRREGLELALYTFKYVKDVNSVLAIVPPPSGQQPKTVLFFRKSDYEDSLGQPLGDTLTPRERLTPGALPSREERLVRSLTLADPVKERFSGVYSYQFQPLPDGTAAVVLSPVA